MKFNEMEKMIIVISLRNHLSMTRYNNPKDKTTLFHTESLIDRFEKELGIEEL